MLPPPAVLGDGGEEKSWSLPKSDAIAAVREFYRDNRQRSDGLPSGHVTAATTLSCGIALLFGGARFIPIAIAWTFLVALSRMY